MDGIKKFYFVYSGRTKTELETLRRLKPPQILISFFYFRNKPLAQLVDELGYRPEILLDSGGFSAYTTGKNIALVDYLKYIDANRKYIDDFIALDVLNDMELTMDYWRIMRKRGYDPIPVFQYLASSDYMREYEAAGCNYVALGATVPESSKARVAGWIRVLRLEFPHTKFHLLGSSSEKIINFSDVYSCDSSTYIRQAAFGQPEHIKGRSGAARLERAVYNMRGTMELCGLISTERG